MQGSSDNDSKSDEDLDLQEFSDDEQYLKTEYRKLLKDSMRLSWINEKMSHKLKAMEAKNSSLTSEPEDAWAKVSQLESQCAIWINNLMDVGKKNELLIAQNEKSEKDMEALRTELKTCIEKNDLNGMLKLALTELESTKSSLNQMNTLSEKLDDILCNQKLTFN